MPEPCSGVKRYILIGLGLLALGLAGLGILLPILPTTPFLLLAAYFFLRSSCRLHAWLLNHKVFGPYIWAYQEHRAISAATRRNALILLWLSLVLSGFFVQKPWLWAVLAVIGIGVSLHLLSLRKFSPEEQRAYLARKAAEHSD